jgi:hypothetical protein
MVKLSGLDAKASPYQSKRALCRLPPLSCQGNRAVPVLDGLKSRSEARFAGYRVAGGCCADAASPTPSASGPTSGPPRARSPAQVLATAAPTAHLAARGLHAEPQAGRLAGPAISGNAGYLSHRLPLDRPRSA